MAKSTKKADKRDNAQMTLWTGGEGKIGIDHYADEIIYKNSKMCYNLIEYSFLVSIKEK